MPTQKIEIRNSGWKTEDCPSFSNHLPSLRTHKEGGREGGKEGWEEKGVVIAGQSWSQKPQAAAIRKRGGVISQEAEEKPGRAEYGSMPVYIAVHDQKKKN